MMLQPGHQLRLGPAMKVPKVALSFQKRLLHHVRRVHLAPQTNPQAGTRDM